MQQQATQTLHFTFMGWGRYNYDPHFTEEETETWKGKTMHSRSHRFSAHPHHCQLNSRAARSISMNTSLLKGSKPQSGSTGMVERD